jgi:predicted acetyltransferase
MPHPERLRLVRLSEELEPAFREMAADYAAGGIDRYAKRAADFPAHLEHLRAAERGEVAPHLVPGTHYFLQDDSGALLGGLRLRHALNDALWQDGGHIGYDIRPSARNRGLATRMLALALDAARARGLPWVLLTIEESNHASIRVAEKNGADPLGRAEKSGLLRFRIDLTPGAAGPRRGP